MVPRAARRAHRAGQPAQGRAAAVLLARTRAPRVAPRKRPRPRPIWRPRAPGPKEKRRSTRPAWAIAEAQGAPAHWKDGPSPSPRVLGQAQAEEAAKAKRTGKVATPTRPGIVDRPGPATGWRPGPAPPSARPAAARASASKSDGTQAVQRPPEPKAAALPDRAEARGFLRRSRPQDRRVSLKAKAVGYRPPGQILRRAVMEPTSRGPRRLGQAEARKPPAQAVKSRARRRGAERAEFVARRPSPPARGRPGSNLLDLRGRAALAQAPLAGRRGPHHLPRSSGAHRTGPPKPGGRGPPRVRRLA